ncbi:MAG: hypothetical protein RI885_2755 [Actinomycetota bacterium]
MVHNAAIPVDADATGAVHHDRPLIVVHGNCQAESVRVMMAGTDVATERIPPAHELTAGDLPALAALLARTDVLISQPVRDDYHGLAIGTRQLGAMMPARSRTVLFPVIRFAGLYPRHLIVRPPGDPSASPPLVAYHDAALLLTAFDRRSDARAPVRRLDLVADQVREIGRRSLHELTRREERHGTVRVSDVFERPHFAQMRTINHPGNPVWRVVAGRIRGLLGLTTEVTEPGRELLDSVHAPRSAVVAEAYGLAVDPTGAIDSVADDSWRVDGRIVDVGEVEEAHLRWYEAHPDAVDAGLTRHADTLALLGLV